jgi:hypothetical protein
MPAEGAIVGTFVVGFTVDITNGQLAYLGFIYSRTEPPPPVGTEMLLNSDWREGNTNGPRSSVLRLFLVNSNLAVGSHLIGTKELQKLGYIAPNPLIEINRLKDLRLDEAMITNEEHNAYRQWTFYITFSPVDAPRVEAAIGDKVLSLMVITVDDDVIMPVIFNEPIGPNGLVRLDVTNFEMMESAKQKFSKLERTVGNQ